MATAKNGIVEPGKEAVTDLGNFFRRAWQIITRRRALIVVGLVAVAAGGGLDSAVLNLAVLPARLRGLLSSGGTASPLVPGVPSVTDLATAAGPTATSLLAAGVAAIVAILATGVLSLIVAAVVARAAAGSLIAGADLAAHGEYDLRVALRSGWDRTWRLILILSIPPIPLILAAIVAVITIGARLLLGGTAGDPSGALNLLRASPGLWAALGIVSAPLALLTLFLGALQPLADRACVLDGLGAVELVSPGVARPARAAAHYHRADASPACRRRGVILRAAPARPPAAAGLRAAPGRVGHRRRTASPLLRRVDPGLARMGPAAGLMLPALRNAPPSHIMAAEH